MTNESDLNLGKAFQAQDLVLGAVQTIRKFARPEETEKGPAPPRGEELPSTDELNQAFNQLDPHGVEEQVAPVRRGTLYGVVRGGFASTLLRARLRAVTNHAGEPIGEQIFDWMNSELDAHEIELLRIEDLAPHAAVEWCTRWIRSNMVKAGLTSCDPENLSLTACRRTIPNDNEPVSTVTVSADFPRDISHMAAVYDPRNWSKTKNPYAEHFLGVYPVTDALGNTPAARPEPIGTTWKCPAPGMTCSAPGQPNCPCWILEKVEGGGITLGNTLDIQFVVTSSWIRLTYGFGTTTSSSSTLTLEEDFGYLTVDPVPGRAGWTRVGLEKNVRFSPIGGTGGGDIGWGNLPNLIAPSLIAKWLQDMRYMPCWDLT
jgi:hypothetical protein